MITEAIPISKNFILTLNIFIMLSLLILLPLINYLMFPDKENLVEIDKIIKR